MFHAEIDSCWNEAQKTHLDPTADSERIEFCTANSEAVSLFLTLVPDRREIATTTNNMMLPSLS